MRTLEFVVDRFRTTAMKEALKTARFLVRLSKKRKDEDSEVLSLTLQKDAPDLEIAVEEVRPVVMQPPVVNGVGTSMSGNVNFNPASQTPKTTSSNEDWNLDVLNDSQFDW
jgi:hypothetical protein